MLGLAPGASLDEARAAYRRLVRDLHPDTRSSALDPELADEALRQVRAAWELLASGAGAGVDNDSGHGWPSGVPGRRFPWWIVAVAVLVVIFVITAYAGSVPVTTR